MVLWPKMAGADKEMQLPILCHKSRSANGGGANQRLRYTADFI